MMVKVPEKKRRRRKVATKKAEVIVPMPTEQPVELTA